MPSALHYYMTLILFYFREWANHKHLESSSKR